MMLCNPCAVYNHRSLFDNYEIVLIVNVSTNNYPNTCYQAAVFKEKLKNL